MSSMRENAQRFRKCRARVRDWRGLGFFGGGGIFAGRKSAALGGALRPTVAQVLTGQEKAGPACVARWSGHAREPVRFALPESGIPPIQRAEHAQSLQLTTEPSRWVSFVLRGAELESRFDLPRDALAG